MSAFEYKSLDEFKEGTGYVIDDFWYPRVTSIVSIKAKPALYRYYAGLKSFDEGERIKEQSASEGTLVHEAVQSVMRGEAPDMTPTVSAAVEAYKKFIEKTPIQVDPAWIEKRVTNYDERYSGTVDAVALIGGKLGVLDIKTSQSIYRDYALQTSAYIVPLEHVIRGIATRWILRIDQRQVCNKCGATLRSKGGNEKIKLPWSNYQAKNCAHEWSEMQGEIELQEFPNHGEDYEAFLGAKKLWEWENLDWLKKIGYR